MRGCSAFAEGDEYFSPRFHTTLRWRSGDGRQRMSKRVFSFLGAIVYIRMIYAFTAHNELDRQSQSHARTLEHECTTFRPTVTDSTRIRIIRLQNSNSGSVLLSLPVSSPPPVSDRAAFSPLLCSAVQLTGLLSELPPELVSHWATTTSLTCISSV